MLLEYTQLLLLLWFALGYKEIFQGPGPPCGTRIKKATSEKYTFGRSHLRVYLFLADTSADVLYPHFVAIPQGDSCNTAGYAVGEDYSYNTRALREMCLVGVRGGSVRKALVNFALYTTVPSFSKLFVVFHIHIPAARPSSRIALSHPTEHIVTAGLRRII